MADKSGQKSKNKPDTEKAEDAVEVKIEDQPAESSADDLQTPKTKDEASQASQKTSLIAKFKALSKKQKILYSLLSLVLVLGVLFATIKPLKLMALNLFSSADVTILVVNAKSEQPLSGVDVTFDGELMTSGDDGTVTFNEVDYGSASLTFNKNAYEPLNTDVSIEAGNVYLNYSINPLGTPLEVTAVNWVNGDSITSFSVSDESGELSAKSDETGQALLNIPPGTADTELTITSDGFNQYKTTAVLQDKKGNSLSEEDLKPVVAELIMNGRHHFLSNRSGRIALLSSNLDGSDVNEVIADTGKSSGSLTFSVTPDGKHGILLAPIKGVRSPEAGTDLEELYIVDLESGDVVLADEGNVGFSVLDVDNNRVIYNLFYNDDRKVREKIKSFSYQSQDIATLVETESIYGPIVFQNNLFFLETKTNAAGARNFLALRRLNLATGEVKSLVGNQWAYPSIIRNSADEIAYDYWDQTSRKSVYFTYNINTDKSTKQTERPANDDEPNRFDNTSPDGSLQSWVEKRDGEGRVVIGEGSNADNPKSVDSGDLSVNYIARWINNDYMIVNGSITGKSGDFIVHIPTGQYKLITSIYVNTYYYRQNFHG